MEHKKALVTGGAGFVGHHLARLLLDDGWEVLALDNFSFGRRENVAPLMDHPRFGLTVTDLTDEDHCSEVVGQFSPNVVFHLAALHFIPYCSDHPSQTMRVNVMGCQHLLETVRNTATVERFIFASTADVYRPQDGANNEEKTPTGSFNIYGISKLFGEDLIRYYRQAAPDVTFVCARFFNIYGPGETNPHVIPDILEYMRASDLLNLGNIEPKRDLVYVTDVAEALVHLAASSVPSTEVNVATGTEHSIREVVRLIAELTGRDLKILRDPAKFRQTDRMHLLGDISKIQRLTGWKPRHSLAEGLAELLEAEGLIPAASAAVARHIRGRHQ